MDEVKEKPPGIYEKMRLCMKEIGVIPKKGLMTIGGREIPFTRDEEVVTAVTRVMVANGLCIANPYIDKVQKWETVTETRNGPKMTHWRSLDLCFQIVDTVTGEKEQVGPIPGEGADERDKGVYKAITNAKKYGLLLAFNIPTGEDVEVFPVEGDSENTSRQPQQRNAAAQQQPRQQQQPPPPEPSNLSAEEITARQLFNAVSKKLPMDVKKLKIALQNKLGVFTLNDAKPSDLVKNLAALNAMPQDKLVQVVEEFASKPPGAKTAEPQEQPQQQAPPQTQQRQIPPKAQPAASGGSASSWSLASLIAKTCMPHGIPPGMMMGYFFRRHDLSAMPMGPNDPHYQDIRDEIEAMEGLDAEHIRAVLDGRLVDQGTATDETDQQPAWVGAPPEEDPF